MSDLRGLRVLVTRPESQAGELCALLSAAGAEPVRLPVIDIAPPLSWRALDQSLAALAAYDWVVFTSANGVRSVMSRAQALGLHDGRANALFGSVRVAAIGPATTQALDAWHVQPAAVPTEYLAERIADAVGRVRGLRFLLLRADIAGDALPRRLRAQGAHVDEVAAYRTVERAIDARAAAGLLHDGVDWITFTSPSTVRGLQRVLGDAWRVAMADARIASIGPVTSAAARAADLAVHVEAAEHTTAGLVRAMLAHAADAMAQEARS